MAMRELVTGGAACAVPGQSSSSNPFGALANALIGSSSKQQVRLPFLLSISLYFVRFDQQFGVVLLKFDFFCEQERLKEIPSSTPTASEPQFYPDGHGHLQQLPGSGFDQPFMQPSTQVLLPKLQSFSTALVLPLDLTYLAFVNFA